MRGQGPSVQGRTSSRAPGHRVDSGLILLLSLRLTPSPHVEEHGDQTFHSVKPDGKQCIRNNSISLSKVFSLFGK